MKNLFKILAAMTVMAGVCLVVYELFRRWDERGRECSEGTLRHFAGKGLRKKDAEDTIADYRYDDDDDLFDDDFFADLDGGSDKVEVEVEEASAADAADDADDSDAGADFDLSEDALEQLLDG